MVTCVDSGGPTEFVVNDVNGFVCAPDPEALAVAFNQLALGRQRAAGMGDAGFDAARRITWDGVVEKLLGC